MSVGIRSQIEQKLVGKMALSSRAFLWLAAAGIIGAVLAFAYVQRSFTPTIDLYFQTGHARGLTKGMGSEVCSTRNVLMSWSRNCGMPNFCAGSLTRDVRLSSTLARHRSINSVRFLVRNS